MNPLRLVDIINEAAQLLPGGLKIGVTIEHDFFLFDGSDDALRVAVLIGTADRRHTRPDAVFFGVGEQWNSERT